MKIAGLEKSSLVDYPGLMAATVFTPGCNWRCFYCHNHAILSHSSDLKFYEEDEVLAWLDTRRGWLDGVVITGGEPTLQRDLPEFIRAVRRMGFLLKLDTNGSNPEALEALLDEGLLDYVAMDIKAPLEKYEDICGVAIDHQAVSRSIDMLLAGQTTYEFRTTIAPQLTEADMIAIAHRIRGARRFVMQQFRRPIGAACAEDSRLNAAPHEPSWPWDFMDKLEGLVECCETRGFQQPPEREASAA